jgi:DNA-binding NarL/FixJ family response regulator
MLVDDHPLVRKGLAALISDAGKLEVCGQAESGESALGMLDDCKPHLIVVDVTLPGINGVDLIKRIRARNATVRILVASMHDESLFAERCLRAGANGYINKESATQDVLEAVNKVLDGEVYLSAEMTSRMLKNAVGGQLGEKSTLEKLSDRELEVFALIGKGLPTREIADRLHLSVKTIETHRDHVRQKLGINSSTELMRHAIQWVLENG